MLGTLDDRRAEWRARRERAAVLCQVGRHEFKPEALKVVPEWPVVYWWTPAFLQRYGALAKLENRAPIRNGMSTQDNTRFLRRWWEVGSRVLYLGHGQFLPVPSFDLALYIKGGEGREWIEDARDVVHWRNFGLGARCSMKACTVLIPAR